MSSERTRTKDTLGDHGGGCRGLVQQNRTNRGGGVRPVDWCCYSSEWGDGDDGKRGSSATWLC